MSATNARNEWYVLTPDGGAQIILHVDRAGRMDAMTEEANYDTHLPAGDRFAGIVKAVADGRVSADITQEEADAVVAAWNPEANSQSVVVERLTA